MTSTKMNVIVITAMEKKMSIAMVVMRMKSIIITARLRLPIGVLTEVMKMMRTMTIRESAEALL